MPARFLEPGQLYTASALDEEAFADTPEALDLDPSHLQPRAVEALRFGLAMPHAGFNLFVLGPSSGGREDLVAQLVEEVRQKSVPQSDYCYVNNFKSPRNPALLILPAGQGARLRDDMDGLAAKLADALSMAFGSEEYRGRIRALEEGFKERQEKALQELGDRALTQGVALIRSPSGFVFAPVDSASKEPLAEEAFDKLPEKARRKRVKAIQQCQELLNQVLARFPGWRHELQEAIRRIGQEAIAATVGQMLDKIRERYPGLPAIQRFLDAVEGDLVETGDTLQESRQEPLDPENLRFTGAVSVQRYQVNLLVDNAATVGQPVVCETLPTLPNLVGRVEHVAHMGTLLANFTLIRAGVLHRANGGYLIMDAGKLLGQPCAWEALKRALLSERIAIDSMSEIYGVSSTVQLQPEPVPLQVKVVLIGEPFVYYLLAELDPEFCRLFKVAADLDHSVPRTAANSSRLARHLATQARAGRLKPLAREALQRLIEHAARVADDAERLSVLSGDLLDLMKEADFLAGDSPLIARCHVEQAMAARIRRADRLREQVFDAIRRDILLIATDGELVGQVNGLATVALADFVFAHPVRISAAVSIGNGEMIDIEREIELGGAIHSKGVMILAGFFAARFGRGIPLSFNASIVFEQTYGEVEGDSASLAELCALLSAICTVPIRQQWAVTGSVNLYGAVQPIGEVNEKIEGYFDACAARGLTGHQGVIIPAANIKDLMLKAAVVEAVGAGQFTIAAVDSVDAAIELLTGLPIGEADSMGIIPPGSINHRVATHLLELHALKQLPAEGKKERKRRMRRQKRPLPKAGASG